MLFWSFCQVVTQKNDLKHPLIGIKTTKKADENTAFLFATYYHKLLYASTLTLIPVQRRTYGRRAGIIV